jgi:hypothetical protein
VACCRAAIWCAVVLAGAAACGTAQHGPSAPATPTANPLAALTADQIARQAIADFEAVSSVRIAGSVVEDGHADFVDVTPGSNGCTETQRIPGQGSISAILIGKTMWFKTDGQIGTQMAGMFPARVRRYLAGKYLEEPGAVSSTADLCGPGQIASMFNGQLKDLVKGQITTISGQPALQLADQRHAMSAYVTMSARPQFLRVDVSGQEHLDFTGYNQPVTFTPPPADEVVTPARLQALAGQAAG